MKRNEEKIKEWRTLFEEKEQKGLTIKSFCQEKNITPAKYYYYRDLIKQNNSQEKAQTPEINKAHIKPIQIINSLAKENSHIRFVLPNNLQCILPRDMDLDEIKKILELCCHAVNQ